jgi:hypothetical protein
LTSATGGFAEAERGDREPVLHRSPDGVDRGLGVIKVFGRVCLVQQVVEETFQVGFGHRRQLDDETHRPSFLRLASSLDWSRSSTGSTGTDTPVW